MSEKKAQNVEQVINKLKSLHDGDLGVIEVIACGKPAIPPLRALLVEREPSGQFQIRCRAVEALASLGAYDVLIDYLSGERAAQDPVEQLGDDAVINAAARALANVREERVFQLLLKLAQKPSLTGVIQAMGVFERPETIPLLINALEEDGSRQAAEVALKRISRRARMALKLSAKLRLPSPAHESESSLRRRRSALRLLYDFRISQKTWQELRFLMQDADAQMSLLACKLCLVSAPKTERRNAVRRLRELLSDADWMLHDEIENCLREHFEIAPIDAQSR
jgi:HEAT repeat protein